MHHASDIITIVDEGGGEFSAGLDTKELSGKTLGASLIYSSRMRQINTNSMLREKRKIKKPTSSLRKLQTTKRILSEWINQRQ